MEMSQSDGGNAAEAEELPKRDVQLLEDLDPFIYTPLEDGQYRVLDLHPGEPDDDIMVGLSVERRGGQDYVAISYCWGNTARPNKIKAGHTTLVTNPDQTLTVKSAEKATGYLMITDSLRKLLLALRDKEFYRRFWVDSLCINQEDIQEKGEQVKLMATIFQNAPQTLAYMGDYDQEAEGCRRIVGWLLGAKREKLTMEAINKMSVDFKDELIKCDDGSERKFLDLWFDFTKFLARDWFNRIWIIQEAILSRNIHFVMGHTFLPWDLLVEACEVVEASNIYQYDHQRPRCTYFLSIERRRQYYVALRRQMTGEEKPENWDVDFQQDMNIYIMQIWSRHCGATDPRDKIFALMNIAVGNDKIWPAIDYTVSITELYVRMAGVWFKTQPSRPFQFLAFVDTVTEEVVNSPEYDLPSWVPDWRKKPRIFQPVARVATKGRGACGETKAYAKFPDLSSPSAFTLPIHFSAAGIHLMKIEGTEKLKMSSEEWQDAKHHSMLGRFSDPYPTTRLTYLEAFTRAVNPKPTDFEPELERTFSFRAHKLAGPQYRIIVLEPFERDGEWVVDPLQAIIKYCEKTGYQGHQATPGSMYGFTQAQLTRAVPPHYYQTPFPVPQEYMIEGRHFFVSDLGYIGLVPDTARPGDDICMLFGGTVLYVLRRLREEDGKVYHRFIGEAFVFGLMAGEVIEGGVNEEDLAEFILE